MSSSIFTKMWQDQETILIYFVWVLWRISCFGCEGKFGDAVVELLTSLSRLYRLILRSCGDLLRNRGSHIMFRILRDIISWGFTTLLLVLAFVGSNKLPFLISFILLIIWHIIILNDWAVGVIHFVNGLIWFLVLIVALATLARNVTGTWLTSTIVTLRLLDLLLLSVISFLGSQRSQVSFLLVQSALGFFSVNLIAISHSCSLNSWELLILIILLGISLHVLSNLIVFQILLV